MDADKIVEIIRNYYPKNVLLNDASLLENDVFANLKKACIEADAHKTHWETFLEEAKRLLNIEITPFILLKEFNPSFIAVFLIQSYSRPKPEGYQPMQLVLKLSVLEPVFLLYFDNLVSDYNKRLTKTNAEDEAEEKPLLIILELLKKYFGRYKQMSFSTAFQTVNDLGNISPSNPRKPFVDECLFGLYLSFHPHNILVDKLITTRPSDS